MRVLLTGSDGYLGSLAAPVLVQAGHEVVGLDTGFYRAGWLYDPRTDRIPVTTRDLREITEADLEGFDAIVHMAELSNDPLGQLNPQLTHEINHRSTVRMATLARDLGVDRFVYMSSCSVYGVADGGDIDETGLTNPQTAYAECKLLVEADLNQLADDGFHPTYLRNATAYGASPRMRMDIVLNNLSGHAHVNKEIRMISDGTPWRPLVHGLDIATAVRCVLDAPVDIIHNETFNVGSTEQNYRVREIAQIVAEAFPGCALSFGDSGGDTRSYRVDFTKINTKLPGFACEWNAERGARQLARLFEAVDLSADDFDGRRYVRLNQLQHLIETGQVDAELFWSPPSRLGVA
jgi:nucleoside-diphosphate-sugar epimerase